MTRTQKKYKLTASTYDRKGNLISKATNNYTKSHPLQAYFAEKVNQPKKIYLHAEIAALLKAQDFDVYEIRIQSEDAPSTFPCPICLHACRAFGVKRIIYHTGGQEAFFHP